MTGAKRWMIWILPDTDWQAWRSQPGTLQNLGRDDLEVFSTIKDPFGLETKSCSKSSRPTTCASVYIWLQVMGAKLAPAQGPYRLVVRTSRCARLDSW